MDTFILAANGRSRSFENGFFIAWWGYLVSVVRGVQPAPRFLYLGTLNLANSVRVANKTEAQDALLAYLMEYPDATLSEAGAAIGRSKSTIGVYVRELSESGRLHKNGHGWEVEINGEL